MKRLFYTLLVIVVTFSTSIFGQTNAEFTKMGDAAMVSGQYTNAVFYYAYTLYKIERGQEAGYYPYEISTTYEAPHTDNNGEITPPVNPTDKHIIIIHKLGLAYLKADDYKNAEKWLTAAVKYPNPEFPNARYHYAVALMYNEQYEAAEAEFTAFQEEIGDEQNIYYKKASSQIANCEFALNPANNDERIQFRKLEDKMNLGSTNFGIQFTSDDHILFSSARIDGSQRDTVPDPLENYMLDLYIASIDREGNIGTPEKFPFPLNTNESHEATATINEDGDMIFFTKMNPENRNETQIYASRKIAGKWIEPFPLGSNVNKEGFRAMSPYFLDSESRLYFASNQPGGSGGLDIWYVIVKDNGDISAPVNLGGNINTIEDEYAPYFQEKLNLFYYSSGGHIGFGGQDIFYNLWDKESETFGQTKNAGAPINSSADESYFTIDAAYQHGYVTSNRVECADCDSLYSLKVHCDQLYAVELPELNFTVSGYVYEKGTNKIIPNARIEFKDVTYQWPHFEIFANELGFYEQSLIPNLELFLRASKLDFFADKGVISTIGEIESRTYEQDFYLDRIPETEITIEGIEYDFDSANLRPESELILDKLIEFLELNHNLKVEIRSHTDIRGNDDYNMRLSERRAQSVVNYLIAHGIPMERLVPKGYGESDPAEITDDEGNSVLLTEKYINSLPTKELREEAHQRNRRTAFFVLEQN